MRIRSETLHDAQSHESVTLNMSGTHGRTSNDSIFFFFCISDTVVTQLHP